jgi:hypothetical protein
MTDPVLTLAAAEARAALARERLSHTLAQLQVRLDPRALAERAKRDVADASQTAVETVKERPAIVGGAAAAVVVFLARHRIAALFRRRHRDRRTEPAPKLPGLRPVIYPDVNPVTRTK